MRQILLNYQPTQSLNVFFYKSIASVEYYNLQLVANKYLLEFNLIKKQHIHMQPHKYLLQFRTCICHRTFNQFSQIRNSLAVCKFYPKSFCKIKLSPISLGISLPFQLKELEVDFSQTIPCKRSLPHPLLFHSYSTTLYLP